MTVKHFEKRADKLSYSNGVHSIYFVCKFTSYIAICAGKFIILYSLPYHQDCAPRITFVYVVDKLFISLSLLYSLNVCYR